ncbi:hypothetical protein LY76DRAFT_156727 [Colletotrichum caudatum]|nr:hypothetical protein LY76DRAFT_156727 [Colletotrichum caudatum]
MSCAMKLQTSDLVARSSLRHRHPARPQITDGGLRVPRQPPSPSARRHGATSATPRYASSHIVICEKPQQCQSQMATSAIIPEGGIKWTNRTVPCHGGNRLIGPFFHPRPKVCPVGSRHRCTHFCNEWRKRVAVPLPAHQPFARADDPGGGGRTRCWRVGC